MSFRYSTNLTRELISNHSVYQEIAPLAFRNQMTIRVGDLGEHEAEFVHQFSRGENCQSDLDGENSESGGFVMGVSEEYPAG